MSCYTEKPETAQIENYGKPCVNWWALPGFILFFMMLFVPTTYQPVKAVLLAIVLSIILISVFLKGSKLYLHRTVLTWMGFYVVLGLLWIFFGYINNAPGALRLTSVYLLWPLVYIFLVAGISNERVLRGLIRVLVVATILIGLYSLSYILHAAGWLSDAFYISIKQGQAIGFYSGFIEYNLYNISSLLFLVPFLIAALLTWPKQLIIPVSRFWLWVALALGLVLVLLSGRRALLFVVALSPIFVLFFNFIMPRTNRNINQKQVIGVFTGIGLILFGLVGYLHLVYGFNMQTVIEMFLQGFDTYHSKDAVVRKMQFYALLEGWSQHLLFGAGHGSCVTYIRSAKQPWAYELSYMALLYQTGLIGFLLYSSGVVWIFWMGMRMIRSGHPLGVQILPVLVGTACFLLGNATNPYLGKYDSIWVIFLPVAFINLWLLQRDT